jgi:hypothetical protein
VCVFQTNCVSTRNCDNSSENNGVFQGYKGFNLSNSGQCYKGVSFFYQPNRHERGSALQNSSELTGQENGVIQCYKGVSQSQDKYGYKGFEGNLFKDGKVGKCPFYKEDKHDKHDKTSNHFKHGLSSIRATGAEIWPVKGKNWTYLTFKDVTFSFSSFYEPDKCAVEHANCDNFSENNGVFQGHVSPYNLFKDGKVGKCPFSGYNLLILRGQIHERFGHTFSSIGLTGAEIWPVKDINAFQILEVFFYEPKKCAVECAVEHVF